MDFLHTLHHLFAGKEGRIEEAAKDAKERIALFERNLQDFSTRNHLALTVFNRAKLMSGEALRDRAALHETITRIQTTLTEDLTILAKEERDDEEILAELKRLATTPVEDIMQQLLTEGKREAGIHALFERLHRVLLAELRATRSILAKLERGQDANDQLEALYDLIRRESSLYEPFMRTSSGLLKDASERTQHLVRAALLGEKFEEKEKSAEELFAEQAAKKMAGGRSQFRKIGEDIFYALLEKAGAPWGKPGTMSKEGARFDLLERLVHDDQILGDIITTALRQRKSELGPFAIPGLMKAFWKAYAEGHFEELENEFYT